MPPQARLPVTKTYPPETLVRVVEDLGDLLDQAVLGALPRVEQGGSGERMMLARWAHAHTTYGAITILAGEQEPDGQTVVILSRPLFEAMVDIYWIHANPGRAQGLAVDNFRLLRIVIPEHYNSRRRLGDPEMPIDGADLAERERLAKLFGSKAQRHWTTVDLRARARAVAGSVPQDADGELLDRFNEDNQLANLLIHGSPMASRSGIIG